MTVEIIRGMSDEEYHEAREYTSHSRIRDFANHGERYYYGRHITGEIARETTRAFDYGIAFEALFQRGGDAFDEKVMVQPEKHDGRTTAGRMWQAAADASGKAVISFSDYQSMLVMSELARTSVHMPLIHACEQQVSLRGFAYGLRIQSRPDWICMEGHERTGFRPFTIDLKTTRDLTDLMTREAVVSLGYHTQACISRRLMQQYLTAHGEDAETDHYLFVVEKSHAHRSALLRINPDVLDYGDLYLDKYGAQLARCIADDDWPVSLPEVIEIGLPRRAQRQHAAEGVSP